MEPEGEGLTNGSCEESGIDATRSSAPLENNATRPQGPTLSKHSLVRTVRLSEDIDRILAMEAENRSMSVNTLMSAILTRFAEWDRFGDKTQRACVPLSQLRRLFESAPAETISEITEEMTTRYIEMAQFSLGSSKLTSIIELLTLFGRHSGLWSLESEVKQSAMTLRFYHDLGRQYSIFLCNSIAGALKKAGASDIQAVEDTHIVTIQIPFGGARSPTPSTELFDAIEAHRRGRMGSLHEYEG